MSSQPYHWQNFNEDGKMTIRHGAAFTARL